jgi:hypothetical protein
MKITIEINPHDVQQLETFDPKRAAAQVELGIAWDETIFAIRGATAQRLKDATYERTQHNGI